MPNRLLNMSLFSFRSRFRRLKSKLDGHLSKSMSIRSKRSKRMKAKGSWNKKASGPNGGNRTVISNRILMFFDIDANDRPFGLKTVQFYCTGQSTFDQTNSFEMENVTQDRPFSPRLSEWAGFRNYWMRSLETELNRL